MQNQLKFLGLTGAFCAFVGLSQMAACTTDDKDSNGGAGGASGGSTSTDGGATDGGASPSTVAKGGSTSTGTTTKATGSGVCASTVAIPTTKPGIADFDAYDGVAVINKWSFALGGDSGTGVFAGPFGYGDRTEGTKTDAIETFDMTEGHESTYALRIKDSMAQKYGGGLGLWIDKCLDASKFAGIQFWVRGNSPTGKGTLTVSMGDTMSNVPNADGIAGTCDGAQALCKHPTFSFDITDTWTLVQAPWSGFKAGDAAGTPVTLAGNHITQLQAAVELKWVPDATGAYVAELAPYELVTDGWAFY